MLKHLLVLLCATTVVLCRPTARNVLAAVRSLSDDELTALEIALGLPTATDDIDENAVDDDEEMQGDQPQPGGNETALDPIKSSWDLVGGRDREQRIKTIMQQVLQFAGRDMMRSNSSLPPSSRKQSDTIDRIYDEMKKIQYSSDIFTEKVQNFHPACELPRNTDEEMWESGQAMKLHFELPFPVPAPGSTIQIQSAKLRLYKVSQAPPNTDEKRDTPQRYPVVGAPLEPEDRKIRVSAYWYTRSLKRNRVKRKLLDSMMLPLFADEWTELNVKSAVTSWKETGKNFGLAVEVENEDGVLLQTTKYFVAMNCSKDAGPARSMPGFIIDAMQNKTAARAVGIHFYPSIEISTIEFPKSTEGSSYGVVKYPLDSVHRLRHNHHRQQSTTPANDSLEQIVWDDPTDR
ncbi:Hypothetical protein NTJ_07522 [Nesidiocoris tenuis]|uniref:TGF-beta propeptide domain-containing protein n=1 Tax=Nesidiocoris tenuis TaxID=355587 RepID=A0ABN7ARN5_9HEMI|nr:Hypothetical protein NTJ_07522 [Nesidiocoris tenuis]